MSLFFVIIMALSTSLLAQSWKIRSNEWSSSHEKLYRDFITRFGDAVKDKKHPCNRGWRSKGYSNQFDCFLNDKKINHWRSTDPRKASYFADCADCAYVVRAYVAYKNHLPFSFVRSVYSHGSKKDPRYSSGGNSVRSRFNILEGMRPFNRSHRFLGPGSSIPLVDIISTAAYRIGPVNNAREIILGSNRDEKSDFYPLPLDSNQIKVGDVVYDARGHAAIIHKVNPDGNIEIVQCHTGGYVSYKPLNDILVWSRAHAGFGLKGWRPQSYQGGQYVLSTNQELIDAGQYSVEQYSTKNQYYWNGQKLNFLDFIKTKISGYPIVYNPLQEFSQALENRCSDLKERGDTIVTAQNMKLDKKSYPWIRLPEIIYQTHRQPWENVSTPARDLRIRAAFVKIYDSLNMYLKLAKENSSQLDYSGDFASLKQDLLDIYHEKSTQCLISYKNSSESLVSFSLKDFIENRLWTMSFDPYHCPEQRWGASGVELDTCPYAYDFQHIKNRWYQAQRTLRNTHIRIENANMAWSINELESIIRNGKTQQAQAGLDQPYFTNLTKGLTQ